MAEGIAFGIFALTLAAAGGAGYLLFLRQPRPAAVSAAPREPLADWGGEEPPGWAAALTQAAEAVGFRPAPDSALRRQLARAGVRDSWAPAAFEAARLAGALAAPPLVFALLNAVGAGAGGALPATILSAWFGYTLPERWLRRRTRSRRAAIHAALPDFLDLLVISIESGSSLDQAVSDTARDLRTVHPELTDELVSFRREILAGAARSEALRNLGERGGEPELKKLTSLLIQADRFGSSVSKVLRAQARYMRLRRKQGAEERAHKVSVKLLFPIFFLIMPSVFLVTAGPAVLMLLKNFSRLAGEL